MKRPVLIGAGLGLLLLATVAGTLWLAGNKPQHAAPVSSPAVVLAPRTESQQVAPAMAVPRVQDPTQISPASQAQRDQRRRLAELRAEFNALRAQGAAASPEKMRAVIDELEALSPAGLDKRYFQTLRELLDISAKVQKLSLELQAIAKSQTPKDAARREEILKEIQALGERAKTQAQTLQSYVPAVGPKAKSP